MANLKDYQEKLDITEKYLDRIDIKYISEIFHIPDVYNLMRKIENDVLTEYYEELEGGIFNYMNADEFMDYLDRRYENKLTILEQTTYKLIFK